MEDVSIEYDDLKTAINGAMLIFAMAQMTAGPKPTQSDVEKAMTASIEVAGKLSENKGYKIRRSIVQ